ncbi:putative ESAT-6-like protein 6 [Mycobacterium kansasii]|uniref:Putative ESAT-6-like protein 6 n=1 Tax=Mycobacterium kansasii TaxID=1768 RepID=A0A1V3WA99_MYCKA|nr:putative ESAT-6-like protein 6 [Mycobacterium kansasii]
MTINYQFGDVDAHGATIRAQAVARGQHQPSFAMCWLPATSGAARFGGLPGVHHPVGSQLPGDLRAGQRHGQKVQAAGSNMAQTDSAVGSSWA